MCLSRNSLFDRSKKKTKNMPNDNALHKAASKGDIEECKKWIENPPEGEDKIDVNELGANDRTALHRAAGGGFLECCQYLVSKGADVLKVEIFYGLFCFAFVEFCLVRRIKVGVPPYTGQRLQGIRKC